MTTIPFARSRSVDPAICSTVPPIDAEILRRRRLEVVELLLDACLAWDDRPAGPERDVALATAIDRAREELDLSAAPELILAFGGTRG